MSVEDNLNPKESVDRNQAEKSSAESKPDNLEKPEGEWVQVSISETNIAEEKTLFQRQSRNSCIYK
jgi:hypothetical protein